MGNGKLKIKQANKKWRHEQKRRQKTRAEKVRMAQAIQAAGRKKNEQRRAARAYIGALDAEL